MRNVLSTSTVAACSQFSSLQLAFLLQYSCSLHLTVPVIIIKYLLLKLSTLYDKFCHHNHSIVNAL